MASLYTISPAVIGTLTRPFKKQKGKGEEKKAPYMCNSRVYLAR